MKLHPGHTETGPWPYKMRMMGAMVLVQLLMLAIVHFWPVREGLSTVRFSSDDEIITLQAPVRTRQQSAPAPPPAPPVPIPVPNDNPIVENEIEFPDQPYSDSFDTLAMAPGEGGQGDDTISGNPEIPPSIVRIEEPTFTNRSPEKADIYVSFLVNTDGTVEEATIEKILLYDSDGRPTIQVQSIASDITQKTIKAALNWKFRPAKVDGKVVRAYTTGIFTVDY